MQKAAAKVITNFRDSQCSHIRRRNAASWSVFCSPMSLGLAY